MFVTDETWNITAVIYSGRDDNPNWVITQDDRKNSNVSVIAKAIDWYTHNVSINLYIDPRAWQVKVAVTHTANLKSSVKLHNHI